MNEEIDLRALGSLGDLASEAVGALDLATSSQEEGPKPKNTGRNIEVSSDEPGASKWRGPLSQ